MSTTAISVTKAEAIAQLKQQIARAELHDAAAAAQHKKDEAAFHTAFKAACRAASRWSYTEAKASGFDPLGRSNRSYGGEPKQAPSCPTSVVRWLQGELNRVELSSQKSYKANPDTSLHKALLWDPTPVVSICE